SVGLSEEFLFRGYAQYTLARGLASGPLLFCFPFCSARYISGTLARVLWEPRASSQPGCFSFSLCEGPATSGSLWVGMPALILARRFSIPFRIAACFFHITFRTRP